MKCIIKTYFLILALILFANNSFSQRKLNAYEKRWALLHPIAAIKTKKIHQGALSLYDSLRLKNIPDAYPNDGKNDAFRHAYFMALFAQKINARKVKRLGILHEKDNKKKFIDGNEEFNERSDSVSTQMDLLNNETGIFIGSKNKKLNKYQMRDLIIESLNQRKLFYVLRNEKGNFTDCDGNELSTEELKKWNNRRCLTH